MLFCTCLLTSQGKITPSHSWVGLGELTSENPMTTVTDGDDSWCSNDPTLCSILFLLLFIICLGIHTMRC